MVIVAHKVLLLSDERVSQTLVAKLVESMKLKGQVVKERHILSGRAVFAEESTGVL